MCRHFPRLTSFSSILLIFSFHQVNAQVASGNLFIKNYTLLQTSNPGQVLSVIQDNNSIIILHLIKLKFYESKRYYYGGRRGRNERCA